MDEQPKDDARSVRLLAQLVRAFKGRQIELRFDEKDLERLRSLARQGLVELSNDGFAFGADSAIYVAKSQTPPVTPAGILFLERLPIDRFVDRPGLFRFLGSL